MKHSNSIIILTFLNCAIAVSSILYLYFRLNTVKEESRRFRGERDMYESLYRKANTRLMHVQDSINAHCICR